MGWANKIIGYVTGNGAEVDAGLNLTVSTRQVNTRLGGETAAPNYVGAGRIFTENDAGSISGSPDLKSPHTTNHRRMSVGLATNLALYDFTATAQNTADFRHAFTTMTMTQSAGFLNVNPALSTVSGNYAYLQSWRHFTLTGDAENIFEFSSQHTSLFPANQVHEFGQFNGTAGVVPVDGAFFRITDAGVTGVISYSGVETTTGVMLASFAINTVFNYRIRVSQRKVSFWIDDVKYGEINTPAANAIPFLWKNLPMCIMTRNSGTVTGGSTTKLGSMVATLADIQTAKPWSVQCAAQGDAYQGGEGGTMGSLAVYSNAAVAAAAAITNTTAAAGNTGLGGVIQVLPTLAAGTDGILCSYQNPAGTATLPARTLVVTGVSIGGGVNVVLSAAAILNLVFGVAYGHTAVSLAQTETGSFATNTTKAPRRVPLGMLNTLIAAAAGTSLGNFSVQFTSPIVVNPSEFFAITMRNLGVVTATGSIVVTVGVDHYFE